MHSWPQVNSLMPAPVNTKALFQPAAKPPFSQLYEPVYGSRRAATRHKAETSNLHASLRNQAEADSTQANPTKAHRAKGDPASHLAARVIIQASLHTSPRSTREDVLTVAAWNLSRFSPDNTAEVRKTISHLQHVFRTDPDPLVILLQGATPASLDMVRQHQWAQ